MPRSTVSPAPRGRPGPGAPPASRHAADAAAAAAATKRALVEVAERLFTEHGYAGTSLERIVGGAQVTKGALYHHFSGKQALFEAVFERVEAEAARRIQGALEPVDDPWAKARTGLRTFLDVVQEPRYRRIVVQDGPAVLGHERYREQEERSTYANVVDIVGSVVVAADWELDDEMVQTFARIFFGAMSSAGEAVADDAAAAERVEVAITTIIAGFQALSDSGAPLPGSNRAVT